MSTQIKADDLLAVDLIEQADKLLSEDYKFAAGVTARAALDACLRQLCEVYSCEPPRKRLRHSCNVERLERLQKLGVFDKATAREEARLYLSGSLIVHAVPGSLEDVDSFVQGVRRFIETATEGGAA